MAARRGEREPGDTDEESPAAPVPVEDHRWLHDAEQELADRGPTREPTTKVGKARMAKVTRAPGPRRRRR